VEVEGGVWAKEEIRRGQASLNPTPQFSRGKVKESRMMMAARWSAAQALPRISESSIPQCRLTNAAKMLCSGFRRSFPRCAIYKQYSIEISSIGPMTDFTFADWSFSVYNGK